MQRIAINRLGSLPAKKASFVEPMECLSVARLPEGPQWLWEIKLDGYRALERRNNASVRNLVQRRVFRTSRGYSCSSITKIHSGVVYSKAGRLEKFSMEALERIQPFREMAFFTSYLKAPEKQESKEGWLALLAYARENTT